MTTHTSDLAAAIADTRDALLEALDALNRAVGHTAHAQELAADLADADTPDNHRPITERIIPASQLKIGMRLACANGYKITGLQFAEGIVRAHVKNSPFNIHDVEYLFAAHDKVTILDDTEPEPEEPMTPVPTRLLDQLREVAPRVVVACNSERDELQPMGYAIAEHDTAEAILAAIDRDNQPR